MEINVMRRSAPQGPSFRLLCVLIAYMGSLPRTRSKTKLDPTGIYGSIEHAQECLNIAWNMANSKMKDDTIANCLRMAFHDAGSYQTDTDEGGANGSIMHELDFKVNPMHNGLSLCGDVIPLIVEDARANGCPELTFADTIQIAGAAAVALKEGPVCHMLMGRPDKGSADDTWMFPSECDAAETLVKTFTRNGFADPVASVAVLSGAHNIGKSHVTGQSRCSLGMGPLTQSPFFDGHYYDEIVSGRRDAAGNRRLSQGWFLSDTLLTVAGAPTRTAVENYATNPSAFLEDWCPHYREMSLLGVDPGTFGIDDGWLPNLEPRIGEYFCRFTSQEDVDKARTKGWVNMTLEGREWALNIELNNVKGMIDGFIQKNGPEIGPPLIAPLGTGGLPARLSGNIQLKYSFSKHLLEDHILETGNYYFTVLTSKYPEGEVFCRLQAQDKFIPRI